MAGLPMRFSERSFASGVRTSFGSLGSTFGAGSLPLAAVAEVDGDAAELADAAVLLHEVAGEHGLAVLERLDLEEQAQARPGAASG